MSSSDDRYAVVAIDGPAASGKSSTAEWVARELGYCHVDSGALYRAATAAALRTGIPPEEWTPRLVLEAAKVVTLVSRGTSMVPQLYGAPADDEIRSATVNAAVSRVARMQAVRSWVNERVREVAAERNVVADGRDMGTAAFPEAAVKVYLVAEGLADVEYPPVLQVKAFDTNLHTIRATFKGKDRFLKLDHDWLSDHPNDAVALLQEKEIAKSLKAGDFALTIQAKGTIKRNL